jgi:deoxycytidylate deaminase
MATSLKGPQIAASLPKKPGPAREDAILQLIKNGQAIARWRPISVDYGPYRATFYVTAEPLMLGDQWEDGFYPGVTPVTMQKVADYYNATLLTPKLVDEIWKQATIRVDPFIGMTGTQADINKMADTDTFVRHSDKAKKSVEYPRNVLKFSTPLIANIGKYWTVSAWTSRKGKTSGGAVSSENYGFFRTAKGAQPKSVTLIPNVDVVQTPGHAHDYGHSDYSQVIMLVARSVQLCVPNAVSGFGSSYVCKDGGACDAPGGPGRTKCIDIYDLANDPKLAGLLSHEGTLNMRLPLVPYEKPNVCALLALAGIGEFSPEAKAFGEDICGKNPPAPGPIGQGAPSGGGSNQVPSSSGVPTRTRRGDKGAAVVAWQKFLISQGYNLAPYGADGDHGKTTEDASVSWEQSQLGKGSTTTNANIGSGTGELDASKALIVGGIGLVAGFIGFSMIDD